VGEQGKVYAHNNTPYLNWLAEAIKARYQPGIMANVERFTAENNQLDLPANTFDAVLMILGYHDVYHVDTENGWERIDGPAMLAQLFQSMKPGAVLGVIDHAAAAGAPPETGETLHRIDPQLALQEITAAGFVFEESSEILANAEDDHSLHSFSEQMRGNTDRFVFRFRRP
jgi:predicted methyltransferase